MNKILNIDQAIRTAKRLRKEKKRIVLAGGIFDILHVGHINFLQKAKEKGDVLFVLLESDETVGKLKGPRRPINTQSARAQVLSALTSIDYVVKLPEMKNDKDYDRLVTRLQPMVIAVTKKDEHIEHKERQAGKIHAQVLFVNDRIRNQSTSRIAKIIQKENII
ncbi:MAG: adenylyltransferase/cytidyltransferase family protein [Candidatus Levyibacteriota bacterium]